MVPPDSLLTVFDVTSDLGFVGNTSVQVLVIPSSPSDCVLHNGSMFLFQAANSSLYLLIVLQMLSRF